MLCDNKKKEVSKKWHYWATVYWVNKTKQNFLLIKQLEFLSDEH